MALNEFCNIKLIRVYIFFQIVMQPTKIFSRKKFLFSADSMAFFQTILFSLFLICHKLTMRGRLFYIINFFVCLNMLDGSMMYCWWNRTGLTVILDICVRSTVSKKIWIIFKLLESCTLNQKGIFVTMAQNW